MAIGQAPRGHVAWIYRWNHMVGVYWAVHSSVQTYAGHVACICSKTLIGICQAFSTVLFNILAVGLVPWSHKGLLAGRARSCWLLPFLQVPELLFSSSPFRHIPRSIFILSLKPRVISSPWGLLLGILSSCVISFQLNTSWAHSPSLDSVESLWQPPTCLQSILYIIPTVGT